MAGELIFLVHREPELLDRLSAALHAAGYKVLTAPGETAAVAHLEQMRLVLPDLVALSLDDAGHPLVRRVRDNPLTEDLPLVALAGEAPDDRRRALRLGITDLVPPPHDPEDLLLTVQLALRRERAQRRDSRVLRGSLALLAVPELLQTLEAGRRSGVVVLRQGRRSGTLWLRQGDVVDAELDGAPRGAEAVFAVLRWHEGEFEASFGEVAVPERISLSTTALLLEGARRQDEEERDAAPPFAAIPDPPPQPPLELLAAHRALTLLNVASAYAGDHVQPALLFEALEQARAALLGELPELHGFRVAPSGQVALDPARPGGASPERVVQASARWLLRLFARLERALPGRFSPERLGALTEAVRDDMLRLGFYDALGLARPSSPESAA